MDGCDHGFSTGFGESEGWLEEACEFFEEQRNARYFAAERLNDHITRIQGACMESVLGGVSDEEPVQFVGDRGLMAKSRGEGDRPKDGSDVNFMYRKERLYRAEKETNAAAPGAAG